MNETMKTSEVLDLAVDAIRQHGWTKGPLGWTPSPGRGLCLEGGIVAAMGLSDIEWSLRDCPAYRAVCEYLGLGGKALWMWNDFTASSGERVIEVLRAAAAVERAKEAAYDTEDQPLPTPELVA